MGKTRSGRDRQRDPRTDTQRANALKRTCGNKAGIVDQWSEQSEIVHAEKRTCDKEVKSTKSVELPSEKQIKDDLEKANQKCECGQII